MACDTWHTQVTQVMWDKQANTTKPLSLHWHLFGVDMGLHEVVKTRGVGLGRKKATHYKSPWAAVQIWHCDLIVSSTMVLSLYWSWCSLSFSSILGRSCATPLLVGETAGLVCKTLMWTTDAHATCPSMHRLQSSWNCWGTASLFHISSSFSNSVVRKNVDVWWIRTLILGVEGKHADH